MKREKDNYQVSKGKSENKNFLANTPEDLERFRAMKKLEVDREELINEANQKTEMIDLHIDVILEFI